MQSKSRAPENWLPLIRELPQSRVLQYHQTKEEQPRSEQRYCFSWRGGSVEFGGESYRSSPNSLLRGILILRL